ncbi:hypothetical protein [Paenibacillus sp. MMO-177]|uniref:hypothetical protein n=1 Tax=Paenibacillus sp. MMO-177 TaxID=3081289 RepID=UPI00301A7A15
MWKKTTQLLVVLQLLALLVTTAVSAAPWSVPESPVIGSQLIYLSTRDEYWLNYYGWDESADSSRLNYWTTTGTYYSAESHNPPNGSWYLTCNGTYILEVFANGVKVGETKQWTTTKIKNPACRSYDNADSLKNDLGVAVTDNGDGTSTMTWNSIPGANHYDIYKDGNKIGETTGTSTKIDSAGGYTVSAVDSNGNVIGESDYIAPQPSTGGGSDGGSGGCDGCKLITDMLACPAWDDYMGEWESMLHRVYQPPNWQQVANVMRDTIVPAMGQELINRSPEMAKIFADEFESREKPVAPPPMPPAAYTPPSVPHMTDLPNKIDSDVTKDVPSFEPDYSGSQGFTIPDPLDIKLSDQDGGYTYPDKTDQAAPDYQGTESEVEQPPQYNVPEPSQSPSSCLFNSTSGLLCMPDYQMPNSSPAPDYQTSEGSDGIPNYQTAPDNPPPSYSP